MKVLILGAGPSGLMAAHAAAIMNHDVVILSKNRKSYMRGAQYLHMPIPMYSKSPFVVDYRLEGTAEGYRDKVYGPDPRIDVSPSSLTGQHFAWDIREAYDGLWDTYSPFIVDVDLTGRKVEEAIQHYTPDMVFSSIPGNALCVDPNHHFQTEQVWVTEMWRGESAVDNTVVCSGFDDDPWYRTSRIHGWANTEYPNSHKPPLSEDKVHSVLKPIKTNCDCHPQILRTGRYGTWTKGVLSHSSFYDTVRLIEENQTIKEHNQ
jgi:hypothetical protein